MKTFSFRDCLRLIQKLNEFADRMDVRICQAQQTYTTSSQILDRKQQQELAQFDSSCENVIADIRNKSQQLISDAERIDCEMKELDARLSSVDKYYVKTKLKKQTELTGVKNDAYKNNSDYFTVLNQVKQDYAQLSKKYSEEILPALLNGLNYLFSGKRKQDYEELIVLQNTLDSFIGDIKKDIPEVTADTIRDMRGDYERERTKLLIKHRDEKARFETVMHSDGSMGGALTCENSIQYRGINDSKKTFVSMNGQEVFRFAVRKVPECIEELISKMKIQKGNKIIMAGFGAGLTWSAVYLEF